VVARNEIIWVDMGGAAGRRPVCVLTRDAAIPVLNALTCAPITRTVRGVPTEVEVGPQHGLPVASVITCDNIVTIPVDRFDPEPVGRLDPMTRVLLDQALRYALDVRF
jgi:mRNA interferase MazF